MCNGAAATSFLSASPNLLAHLPLDLEAILVNGLGFVQPRLLNQDPTPAPHGVYNAEQIANFSIEGGS